ncbi:MAG TPA: hypothetical protein VKP30_25950, partial [Polyangiaceae bacterium]|nr:hypothetical protein [Polyangiaceae bacterium]
MKKYLSQLAEKVGISRLSVGLATTISFSTLLPAPALADTCSPYRIDCAQSADCPIDQTQQQQLICVEGTCQYPCADGDNNPSQTRCSLGEACVPGTLTGGTSGGSAYYCQSVGFHMDLNLLDSCIYHFVEGLPVTLDGNACTLTELFSQFLDQDGKNGFNIYDVDLCIKSFLSESPCNPSTKTCAKPGQVYCDTDDVCGDGLFCNTELHRCERECGMIVARNSNLSSTMERKCTGGLQVCDYGRGRCKAVDLSRATCAVDGDCPVGAYCLLGMCRAECSRSLDCPDGSWSCDAKNQCVPKPKSATAEVFNPKDYSVLFSEKAVSLDAINNQSEIPLVIMDTRTGQQVFGQPNVVFGYRLELSYGRRLSPECVGNLTKQPIQVQIDCRVDADKEFITLENPFGTVYGEGDPSVQIRLNAAAAEKLPEGTYEATLRAFFNNGTQSSTTVRYNRPSLSGDYVGSVEINIGGPKNVIADANLHFKLSVSKTEQLTWQSLLDENHLAENDEFQDVTSGYKVVGYLDGNDTTIFTKPSATTKLANRVAVEGIYSPQLARMRLIGVIEHGASDCAGEAGACASNNAILTVKNPFGRRIRRLIEFIGPFDSASRAFSGTYRETFSGLTPSDITLDGSFRVYQSVQDPAIIADSGALIPAASAGPVGFPTISSVVTTIDADIAQACTSGNRAAMKSAFASDTAFDAMMATYDTSAPALVSNLVRFESTISSALDRLGDNPTSALTIADYFKGQILFCNADGSSPTKGTPCIDRKDLECGLALFKKAIVSQWVDKAGLKKTPALPPLFCDRSASSAGSCAKASENPRIAALQEHNRFYRELVQTWTYSANSAWSDGFYAMYKAADGDPLDQAEAFDYKSTKMKAAIDAFSTALGGAMSTSSTVVLFGFPVAEFQTGGQAWLDELYTVTNDRLEATLNLLSLKRRKLDPSLDRTLFAHHVIQYEYLRQVFLGTLQLAWQGSQFAYRGEGRKALLVGQNMLAAADTTRNPLGLHPNRVFFENSHLDRTNWQNYMIRVEDLLNRKVGGTNDAIAQAIREMKAALTDKDALANALSHNKDSLAAELTERCGAEGTATPACNKVDFNSVATQWSCNGADCAEVIERVKDTWSSSDAGCRKDIPYVEVNLSSGPRRCMGGRVGALLQERAALQLQRKTAISKVGILVRQIERERAYMEETVAENADFLKFLSDRGQLVNIANFAVRAANAALDAAYATTEAFDCLIIVGLAGGTDCPGKIAKSAARVTATSIKSAIADVQQTILDQLALEKELKINAQAMGKEERALRQKMDELVTNIESIIAEIDMVNQNISSVETRISDELLQAQEVAARLDEQLGSVVDQLLGRESGSVLRRNKLIEVADA